MKVSVKQFILLFIVFICRPGATAQIINTTIGTVSDCSYEVAVPVLATNLNDVGAISLALNFNEEELVYTGFQNAHESLGGGMLIVNAVDGKVMISWVSTSPASIDEGVLLELVFQSQNYGQSNLSWDVQTPGNCEYSSSDGTVLEAAFINGSVTWWQEPLISSQPDDRRILEGETTTISVSATGVGLSYQWQVSIDEGENFIDLSNVAPYSNVTTANLRINSSPLELNGYHYRCVISGTCEPQVNSDVVVLNVVRPVIGVLPAINTCPGELSVAVVCNQFDEIAAFSLSMSFDSQLMSFTGVENVNTELGDGLIINETEGTIYLTWASLTPVTIEEGPIVELLFEADTGSSSLVWNNPDCEFVNIAGLDIQGVFQNGSVNIFALPQIHTQPVSRVVAESQNTSFSVGATGTGISYQWQVSEDGGDTFTDLNHGGGYSGVTSQTMSITNVGLNLDGNIYRCRVAGSCEPGVDSREVTLTVLPNIVISLENVTTCPGLLQIPVRTDDFSSVASFSMSLQYNDEVLTFSGYDGLHENLSDGMFDINADEGTLYLTWVNIVPAAIPDGEAVVVLEFEGLPGASSLTWNQGSSGFSNIDGMDIYSTWQNGGVILHQNPVITSHPGDQSIYGSGSVHFSVTAVATGLSYRWQVSTDEGEQWTDLENGGHYNGVTTANLTVSNVTTLMDGNLYRCRVSGNCPPDQFSEEASLEVTTPAITASFGHVSGICDGTLYLPIEVTNFNHVGGVSLALSYDPGAVSYAGYAWVHPELESGLLTVNQLDDMIYISWASAEPANIGDDLLLELRFDGAIGLSTSFTWDSDTYGNCEFSSFYGAVIPSHYANRSIHIVAEFPEFEETDEDEICEGQIFNFGRQELTTQGIYTELFRSQNGCDSTVVLTLIVHSLPELSCPADVEVCLDVAPFEITGATPVGGLYTGIGVDDGVFDPAIAGSGIHEIIYHYTDNNACENSCTFNIEVFELPELTCPADLEACIDAAPFAITGATPLGGIYTGAGVEDGVFDPALAGVGVHEIEYHYSDGNDCSNSCTFYVEVFPLPQVSMPADMTLCEDESPVELTGADPAGGIYSGPGVSDGFFDASEAGMGEWMITYIYTDLNGCSAGGEMKILVEVCTGFGNNTALNVLLYPNPANDRIFVEVDQPSEVIVVDLLGRALLKRRVSDRQSSLDISTLTQGVYTVLIYQGDKKAVFRLVVQE